MMNMNQKLHGNFRRETGDMADLNLEFIYSLDDADQESKNLAWTREGNGRYGRYGDGNWSTLTEEKEQS